MPLNSKNPEVELSIKHVVIVLLSSLFYTGLSAQESYNSCDQAFELCPQRTFTLNNIGANKTVCSGCEDDFIFCFSASNTIWLKFTTNANGGDVNLDFSNLNFQTNPGQGNALQATIMSATVPCNSVSYTALGNCVSNGTLPFTLTATTLTANTTYYVVVNGLNGGTGVTQAAECTFDIVMSGTAVDRPIPTLSITSTDSIICYQQEFTAVATYTDCPDNGTYKWYINNVFVAETTDSVFHSSELENGDTLRVETSCYSLCSEIVTDSLEPVTVISFPVDAGIDQTITAGQTIQLHGTTTAPVYSWSPSFLVSDTSSLTPWTTPPATTTYTLSATQDGCTISDYVIITIPESLIIPTTFSPNGDGVNDVWEIQGIENYPDNFVTIYNRWGQTVYQGTGYKLENAWNGNSENGRPLSEGVYFYIISLKDADNTQKKGSISLIR